MVRLLITITACLLISEFLGLVTLNSPGEISALQEIFSIHQQITELFIFRCILVFGDLLVPPRFACNLT